jgi:endonuclease G
MRFYSKTLVILAALVSVCVAQNVTIKHKVYTTVFSKSQRIPVAVKWWLTKAMLDCPNPMKRTNDFKPDPKLPDYTDLAKDYAKSGYDQGHNCDAADNLCDTVAEHESFYYSNMCPQTARLNSGIWKVLEDSCRTLALKYDSTLIWCGSVATSGKTIGPDKVAVPDYCWKVVYVKQKRITMAFVFPNTATLSGALSQYRVKLDSVKHLSGIKFNRKR